MADSTELTEEERGFIEELMALEANDSALPRLLEIVPLALGVLIIVAAALITVLNLNDHTALWVLLPGVGAGLVLVALHLFLFYHRRTRQFHASVVRKLMWAAWRREGPRGNPLSPQI